MSIKNPRLFKMREKLLPFNLEAEYLPGDQMRIADYGSRAPISTEDQ